MSSTALYTTADMTFSNLLALDGAADLQVFNGTAICAYNKPPADSSHDFRTLFDANLTDSSTNANATGVLEGAYTPTYTTGTPAMALRFGASQYMTIGANNLYGRSQAYTFSCLIRLKSSEVGAVANVIYTSCNVNDGKYPGNELFVAGAGSGIAGCSAGTLCVRIIKDFGASNYLGVFGSTDISDGNWHSVVVTYDGSSTAAGVKIYVGSGSSSPTLETMHTERDTLTTDYTAGADLRFGNQNGFTYQFKGLMSHLAFCASVRDSTYIASHKVTDPAPLDASHSFYAACDDWTGVTVYDRAGGFNGTLTNGVGEATSCWELQTSWQSNHALRCAGGLGTTGALYTGISAYHRTTRTYSAWFFDNSATNSTKGGSFLVWLTHPSNWRGFWAFFGYGGAPTVGAICEYMTGDSPQGFRNTTTRPSSFDWDRYDYELDGTANTLKIYLNGTLLNTFTSVGAPIAPVSTTKLGIGGGGASSSDSVSYGTQNALGDINLVEMSSVVRGWASTYATRYAATGGIAYIAKDLGANCTLSQLDLTYFLPHLSSVEFRVGVDSNSAATALTNANAASWTTAALTQAISGTGRYINIQFRVKPSTDSRCRVSAGMRSALLTYTVLPGGFGGKNWNGGFTDLTGFFNG